MPFITDAVLKTHVAAVLKFDESTLPAYWNNLIASANESAYLDIRGALIQRGYLANQVDVWPRGAEFNRDLGVFWALVKGAGLHNYDDKFIKLLDRREELKDVLVEGIDAVVQTPQGSPAAVGYGNASTTNDRFNLDQKW